MSHPWMNWKKQKPPGIVSCIQSDEWHASNDITGLLQLARCTSSSGSCLLSCTSLSNHCHIQHPPCNTCTCTEVWGIWSWPLWLPAGWKHWPETARPWSLPILSPRGRACKPCQMHKQLAWLKSMLKRVSGQFQLVECWPLGEAGNSGYYKDASVRLGQCYLNESNRTHRYPLFVV